MEGGMKLNEDADALAREFIEKTHSFRLSKPQKEMDEFLRGEIFILQYIYSNNGSAQPREISSAMRISSARIAAALGSMEKKGFIVRSIDSTDRRKIVVRLTSAGENLARERENTMLSNVKEAITRLGTADTKEFLRILDRLIDISKGMQG